MALLVPASLEAEEALLGSMFIYPDSLRKAYEADLQANEFFNESNRKIYQVVLALVQENKPVDVTSVTTRLTDLQQLANVGGAEYILHLTDVAITSANSDYYIQTIKEKALLRQLIEVSESIKTKSYEGQYDANDVLNEAQRLIDQVSRQRRTTPFKNSKETFDEVIKNLNYLSSNDDITGVLSGYKYLDNITNGFQKGDLIIIGARPAVGKTAFALNLCVNAAVRGGKSVALFSLEMPYTQLGNRMLSAKSSVDSNKIRTGRNLTNEDWAKIDEAKSKLEKAKIFIDDSSMIKVNDIVAKCRKLKADEGLDMIIIDYLQLITASTTRNDSRALEVGEISRGLKQMARELDVPVIALSQLSRNVESAKREPQLSDLRESGSIEQDADIVMFLHRDNNEKEDDNQDKQFEDLKVIIAKHRNGSVGYLWLAFDNVTNAFFTKENNLE